MGLENKWLMEQDLHFRKNGREIKQLTVLLQFVESEGHSPGFQRLFVKRLAIPVFTPCRVHEELSTLDISKSPGLYQLCGTIVTAFVPSDSKVAAICPIFKKGDPENVAE